MTPTIETDRYSLYLGDCRDILPTLGKMDAVVTDPPYPDWLADEYSYRADGLEALLDFECRQFVFWSAKEPFPLDHTAIHIWDKLTGCGSEYERIFERNGERNWKMFRNYFINSTVAAQYQNDVFTGHASQKPLRLISALVAMTKPENGNILDPFMGSGTTGVAAMKMGRRFIGIEIEKRYFDIAARRIEEAANHLFAEVK